MQTCKNCDSSDLELFEDYIFVCKNCGIENDKNISNVAEWRSADKSRCMTVTSSESTLTTAVKGNSKFNKYSNSMKYGDRKKMETKKEFDEISEKHNLPGKIVSTALDFFNKVCKDEKAHGQKLIKRGGNLQGIKAACLYLSYVSFKDDNFKTQKEIADLFQIKLNYLQKNLPIVQSIVSVNFQELSSYNDFINNCFDQYNSKFIPKIPFSLKQIIQTNLKLIQYDSRLQKFMNKSVACGLFFNVLKNYDFDIKNMEIAWKISVITIQKVEKVISSILS